MALLTLTSGIGGHSPGGTGDTVSVQISRDHMIDVSGDSVGI